MNGELDFTASLKERVSLLKGVPADVFDKLQDIVTIAPGARELCKALKALGFKMAVLSGGFQPLADWLAKELGIDYAFANHVCLSPFTNFSREEKKRRRIRKKEMEKKRRRRRRRKQKQKA